MPRRSIKDLLSEKKQVCGPRRKRLIEASLKIIHERMEFLIKMCQAPALFMLFDAPDSNLFPRIYGEEKLTSWFKEDRLKSIQEVFKTNVEELNKSGDNDFNKLSFSKQKQVLLLWIRKGRQHFGGKKYTEGNWPKEMINWIPKNIPYSPISKWTKENRIDNETWVHAVLIAFAKNVGHDLLRAWLYDRHGGSLKLVDKEYVISVVSNFAKTNTIEREEIMSSLMEVDETSLKYITDFWLHRNVTITQSTIGEKPIHLGFLWNKVKFLGGFDEVNKRKKWVEIAEMFGISKNYKNRGNKLKSIWMDVLNDIAIHDNAQVVQSQASQSQASLDYFTMRSPGAMIIYKYTQITAVHVLCLYLLGNI